MFPYGLSALLLIFLLLLTILWLLGFPFPRFLLMLNRRLVERKGVGWTFLTWWTALAIMVSLILIAVNSNISWSTKAKTLALSIIPPCFGWGLISYFRKHRQRRYQLPQRKRVQHKIPVHEVFRIVRDRLSQIYSIIMRCLSDIMRYLLTVVFMLIVSFVISCKNDNSANISPVFTLLHRSVDDQSKAKEKEEEAKEEKEGKEGKIDPNAELAKKYAEVVDYLNPITRDYAVQVAAWSPGAYNYGQICEIYDYLCRRWRYVNDPYGVNYVSPASRTILANLVGDCDDYAVLMAAMIAAIGGNPSVIVAWNDNNNTSHAYPEVYVGDQENFNRFAEYIFNRYRYQTFATPCINYHKNLFDRYWLSLDWNASFPGGPFFESTRGIRIFLDGTYEKIK